MLGFITKFEQCLDKIHNFLFYEPPKLKVVYKKNTFNHHNVYKDEYCNQLIKKKSNLEYFKSKHIKNFKNVLDDINNKKHIIFFTYNNNFKELLKYKLIILNFKNIYDEESQKIINFTYFKYLSEFLHKNKIIFCIVSEINPRYFPNLKYFNKVNLITPFHYKKKTFGGAIRIGLNTYSDKSVEVNFNQILTDIKNQYGMDDNEIIYINSEKVDNVNTHLIIN